MSKETELKFLPSTLAINALLQHMGMSEGVAIKQGYLFTDSAMRGVCRVRQQGTDYVLCLKLPSFVPGVISVTEIEAAISEAEFSEGMTHAMSKVSKTRYEKNAGTATVVLDKFHDELEGLHLVEFEVLSEEDVPYDQLVSQARQFFEEQGVPCGPNDLKDVTSDYRYTNKYLSDASAEEIALLISDF